MKVNSSTRFYTKTLINIIYSATITVLVELFAVTNIAYLAPDIAESQKRSGLLYSFIKSDNIVLLLFLILGILIFSGVFWMFQRRTIAYIDYIYESVKLISKGDFSVDLNVVGDDEFSDMAAGLNAMVKDIRRIMEKEREAEKTKNELITNVAHDLRTPLTSIIGYLELLNKSENLSEDLRTKYTDVAFTKAKRLEKLVEDLFGFTKLNYGKITMKVESFDLVKLLTQLVDEFYPVFEKKHLAFELKTTEEKIMFSGDSGLLVRLFDNLINNAVKYGAEGKRVDISVENAGEYIKAMVTNYGKVIPEEDLPMIFNRFYRVERSRAENTGGTGLGLAIAKTIAEMHGGTIGVKSNLNGTSFIVLLKKNLNINEESFENVV